MASLPSQSSRVASRRRNPAEALSAELSLSCSLSAALSLSHEALSECTRCGRVHRLATQLPCCRVSCCHSERAAQCAAALWQGRVDSLATTATHQVTPLDIPLRRRGEAGTTRTPCTPLHKYSYRQRLRATLQQFVPFAAN
jgi:hypothetical protein